MRIITMAIPTIAQLGLPPVVADLTDKPHGLILVTEATGSGKSTSLDAMVDHINSLRASRRTAAAPGPFRSMPSAFEYLIDVGMVATVAPPAGTIQRAAMDTGWTQQPPTAPDLLR